MTVVTRELLRNDRFKSHAAACPPFIRKLDPDGAGAEPVMGPRVCADPLALPTLQLLHQPRASRRIHSFTASLIVFFLPFFSHAMKGRSNLK